MELEIWRQEVIYEIRRKEIDSTAVIDTQSWNYCLLKNAFNISLIFLRAFSKYN